MTFQGDFYESRKIIISAKNLIVPERIFLSVFMIGLRRKGFFDSVIIVPTLESDSLANASQGG